MEEASEAREALTGGAKAKVPVARPYLIHHTGEGSLPPSIEGESLFCDVRRGEKSYKAHISGLVVTGFLKNHGDLLAKSFPPNSQPFMIGSSLSRDCGFVSGDRA